MAKAPSTERMWGPRAIVDSAALRHNLTVVRRHAPHARVMAVIKANAYGHGIVATARALSTADAFGVARLPEALVLRGQGLSQRIVLLEGVFASDELTAAADHGLEIVVHSFEQLRALSEWRGSKLLHAWLKVDTGMNRLGFRLEDFETAWTQLRSCAAVAPNPKVMTHLACADERDSNHTDAQVARFRSLVKDLRAERSAANSAGLLAWPQAHMDWVRPGLMLYGVSPFPGGEGRLFGLRPAMTLVTRLIAVRSVKAGERVGYGGAWTATVDTRIGIAAIGYGDGYPRQIGNGSPVHIGEFMAQIAGRVSMDMVAIDLGGATSVAVGDEVTLWGGQLPVERLAECAGTIPYELICGIGQRVAVEYR
jgi:alanine racemase